MIIAVTGGTGFIGRRLIMRHLALGDEVRYLTRNKPRMDLEGVIPFIGHLNSPAEVLRRFLSGADVLYHCAAELRDEGKMYSTNVAGTANLLAAATGEIKRWVQLSSTGVYGNPRHQEVNEDFVISPVNVYEKTKFASDEMVSTETAKHNMDCVILRPSNVYGIDMPNQSLFHMIAMIDKGLFFFIGNSGAIANYIHVDNVVDALLLGGKVNLPESGRVYIVSDHCKLETFVDIAAAALNKPARRIRLPESLVRWAAGFGGKIIKLPLTQSRIDALTNTTIYKTDRIRSELGYSHSVSIEEGIAELTRFWKSRAH